MALKQRGFGWIWVAIVVFIIDQGTKNLAKLDLFAYVPKPIFPGFNLTLCFNKGAAFSFLSTAAGWQSSFFSLIAVIISLGIIYWLSRIVYRERLLNIALCLILGGALGNLWDRLHYGYVIDFLQFYVADFYWPVFNLADSAICVGVFLLFWRSVLYKK